MTRTHALVLGVAAWALLVWGLHVLTYPDALKYRDRWWWVP